MENKPTPKIKIKDLILNINHGIIEEDYISQDELDSTRYYLEELAKIKFKPISEEDFCEIIDFMAKRQKNEFKINELFTIEFGDSMFYPHSKYEMMVVNLLEKLFKDEENGWITYFLYELDCGKSWKPGTATEGDKDIPLSNAKELYALLVENLEKNL